MKTSQSNTHKSDSFKIPEPKKPLFQKAQSNQVVSRLLFSEENFIESQEKVFFDFEKQQR